MAIMTHGAKTKKALLKRVKITGSGKILKRHRQDYFSASDASGTRHKKGHKTAPGELVRSSKALLSKYF